MLDKRRFPRLDEEWELDYRTITSEEFKADPISSITLNISGEGICFEANEEISKGTMLALELKPKGLSSPVIALAKAIWCKKQRRKDKYDVGAEFWWVGWTVSNVQQSVAKYIEQRVT